MVEANPMNPETLRTKIGKTREKFSDALNETDFDFLRDETRVIEDVEHEENPLEELRQLQDRIATRIKKIRIENSNLDLDDVGAFDTFHERISFYKAYSSIVDKFEMVIAEKNEEQQRERIITQALDKDPENRTPTEQVVVDLHEDKQKLEEENAALRERLGDDAVEQEFQRSENTSVSDAEFRRAARLLENWDPKAFEAWLIGVIKEQQLEQSGRFGKLLFNLGIDSVAYEEQRQPTLAQIRRIVEGGEDAAVLTEEQKQRVIDQRNSLLNDLPEDETSAPEQPEDDETTAEKQNDTEESASNIWDITSEIRKEYRERREQAKRETSSILKETDFASALFDPENVNDSELISVIAVVMVADTFRRPTQVDTATMLEMAESIEDSKITRGAEAERDAILGKMSRMGAPYIVEQVKQNKDVIKKILEAHAADNGAENQDTMDSDAQEPQQEKKKENTNDLSAGANPDNENDDFEENKPGTPAEESGSKAETAEQSDLLVSILQHENLLTADQEIDDVLIDFDDDELQMSLAVLQNDEQLQNHDILTIISALHNDMIDNESNIIESLQRSLGVDEQ